MAHRIIAHCDMDAFFAAVEERDHAWLAGLPVVVGADPCDGRGRGVVATANYPARAYGIHSAMPIGQAWRLSQDAERSGKPPVVFRRGSGKVYRTVSKNIFNILSHYSETVVAAGIDEAFLDFSHCETYTNAAAVANAIKKNIHRQEKLTCSIGIGPNKLIAKIASDMQKPDGLTIVRPDDVQTFLTPLPIRKIPGIGPKTEMRLHRRGIFTVHDLQQQSRAQLTALMGKWGAALYHKARGEESGPLVEHYARKSLGSQRTFFYDMTSPAVLFEELQKLCTEIFHNAHQKHFHGCRTVVVTVRFANFLTRQRSHTCHQPITTLKQLRFEAMKLLAPFFDGRENRNRFAIRLLGVRIQKN